MSKHTHSDTKKCKSDKEQRLKKILLNQSPGGRDVGKMIVCGAVLLLAGAILSTATQIADRNLLAQLS
jgi:hypothetical protein